MNQIIKQINIVKQINILQLQLMTFDVAISFDKKHTLERKKASTRYAMFNNARGVPYRQASGAKNLQTGDLCKLIRSMEIIFMKCDFVIHNQNVNVIQMQKKHG